ncbi:MAG: hypothetical protein K8S98_11085 [Planctomycetes bacterium]|nr:hypothetical protein [Planctomycetota bacterium]
MLFARPRSGRVLTVLLLASGVVSVAAWSSLQSARAAANAAVVTAIDEELEGSMREMNGAMKVLGRGVTAENRDAALEALTKFERAVVAAKAATPEKAATVEEKKRPEFVVGYRKTLIEVLKLACDAEVAILDGKYKDADTIIKNKLMGLKNEGHDKYKQEEGEGEGGGKKH